MKGFFAKLKDFSPKLKVSEIMLFLKPQNRWKKAWTNVHGLLMYIQDMVWISTWLCFSYLLARAPVEAGWGGALVKVLITEPASPAKVACAGVVGDCVNTNTSMRAVVLKAFVNVGRAQWVFKPDRARTIKLLERNVQRVCKWKLYLLQVICNCIQFWAANFQLSEGLVMQQVHIMYASINLVSKWPGSLYN